MKSQIYTHQSVRDLHVRQINDFVWPFHNKILPQFQNIEAEADNATDEYLKEQSTNYCGDDDPYSYYEAAEEYGFAHYNLMTLGLYTATLAWHATLFEFFHQQLRLFLFNEMRHSRPLESKTFCQNFSEVREIFQRHNFDVCKLKSWRNLIELQTLCNAIKHGDGNSLHRLREIAPQKFKISHNNDLFDLYKTTLLEATLDLNAKTLSEYTNAIIEFWHNLPERCYSDEF